MPDVPTGLRAGGKALWLAISESHDLDAAQQVQLVEACRAKDRLDQFDQVLRAGVDVSMLAQANATARTMKELLTALRLPDAITGRRPQYRGPRGALRPRRR